MSNDPGSSYDSVRSVETKSAIVSNDSNRVSLLDVVLEGIRNQNATRVNRMVLVGELTSANDAQAFVSAISENKSKVEGKLTGLTFIINKTAFVTVIEATFDSLIDYLQGLVNSNSTAHFMSSDRVLTSVEDVERMFPTWDVRLKRVPKAEQNDFSSENLAQTAFETVKHLLQLGAALQGMNKAKCSEFLDSQKREVMSGIPSSELLSFYSHSVTLFPLENYLDVFYKDSVKIDLDGERVFPIDPFLEY